MVVGAVVAILILQPDVGMTAVVALTFGFQMLLGGLPLLLILLAPACPIGRLLAYSFLGHVQVRVDKFFAGGANRKVCPSFVEGGWYGVGPGDGQVKLYLPDAHADFIFSVAAENMAFWPVCSLSGCSVLWLFAAMPNRCLPGMFSMLAVSGLATQFGVQAAIHMASSLNLIPTKGMTLPLLVMVAPR